MRSALQRGLATILLLVATPSLRTCVLGEVTVTLPTGAVETFEVTVTNPCALYQPVIDGLALAFTPVDNTLSSLAEVNPLPLRLVNGQLVDNGSYELYDPSRYTLTTKAGYVYTLDQGFGILKFEDPNGNTVTYTPNGILHSSGLSVVFERGGDGRIHAIRDPNGNVRRYSYDARGDLVAAAEPVAADSPTPGASTAYTYYGEADGFAHYLDEIRDPLGRKLLKNLYNEDGRLVAQEDGNGQRIEFSHHLTGRTSVVTNRRGYSTQYAYDAEGRILTQIDALNGVTTNEGDARGNLLAKTNALNEVTRATYNDRNDQLTQTDGEGHTTTYTHNLRGQELTVTDARQNTYAMAYDTVGNLLTLRDPLDQVTGNMIGAKGLLQKTTNALNQATSWTYDSEGRKQTETNALGHVTRWTYDTNGNVLTESRTRTVNGTPVTETVTHTYDSRNRRISTTDALGHTTRVEYDLAGQESARLDALGRRTEMDHDAYGRLTETRYPDGTRETQAYDAEGNKTRTTDRLGRTTTYEYDALNRLVRTTQADGTHTRTEYDAVGRVMAEIDAAGNRTEYDYDRAGRRVTVRNALGQEQRLGYDADGNLVSETDALNRTTTYVVDALDRRTEVRFADGALEKIGYDALGRVTEKEDPLQRKTRFSYDAGGRLVEVTDHRSQVTRYGYDEAGNKTRQTDALQRSTTWTHDANGQVLTHTLPLGQAEAFTYDATGNITTHTDFNGQRTSFVYDVNGRPREVRHADGGTVVTTYDAVGNRLAVADTQLAADGAGLVTQTTTYGYDLRDRLKSQANPDNSALAYAYDAVGNRTALTATYPNGTSSRTVYAYDALNQLENVTGNEGETTYAYDAKGRKKEERLPNGIVTTWQYNDRDGITRLTASSATGVILRDDVYTLDALNRRTDIQEARGRATHYDYDDLNRLIAETQSGGDQPIYSASYEYDAVGNRSRGVVNGDVITYVYDANDRLETESSTLKGTTTYHYDNAGSLIRRQSASGDTQYAYNARLRLLRSIGASGTTEYVYDADGNRVAKLRNGNRISYLIDANRPYALVQAELDAAGQPLAQYTLDNGLRRLSQNTASGFRFYLYDAHGSVRSVADSSAAATHAYDFDAFGNALRAEIAPGEAANDFRYNGEQWDEETGHYYLRARQYDPTIGRFTQWDTYEGAERRPLSLNHYIYANADAVNRIDPSGHVSIYEMQAANDIAAELQSHQQDAAFSLMDKIGSGVSPEIAAGSAVIGSFELNNLLSRKHRRDPRIQSQCRTGGCVNTGGRHEAFDGNLGRKLRSKEYPARYHVYVGRNSSGEIDYVGISNDVPSRIAQHRRAGRSFSGNMDQITPVPLPKPLARGIEQSIIYLCGRQSDGSGRLENQINSIAENNDWAAEAAAFGMRWIMESRFDLTGCN